MSQAPDCPVCGNPLRATGVNPDMYYCTRRRVWVSDLGLHLDIVDATIHVAPDGRRTYKVIEVPPYSFTIIDDKDIKQTIIRKVMPEERIPGMKRSARRLERKIVLDFDFPIKMRWNDKEKVLERMKLYLLFS